MNNSYKSYGVWVKDRIWEGVRGSKDSGGVGVRKGDWGSWKGWGVREGGSSLSKNPQHVCNNPKYSFFCI